MKHTLITVICILGLILLFGCDNTKDITACDQCYDQGFDAGYNYAIEQIRTDSTLLALVLAKPTEVY